jgi:hypothetical protein
VKSEGLQLHFQCNFILYGNKCPPVADQDLVYICATSDPHAPDDDCIVPTSQHTFFLKIHHIHSCIQYHTFAQMILALLGCFGEFAPQLSTPRSNNKYICCYHNLKLKIQNNVWVFITQNITYKCYTKKNTYDSVLSLLFTRIATYNGPWFYCYFTY